MKAALIPADEPIAPPPIQSDNKGLLMTIIKGQSVTGSWKPEILSVLNPSTAKPEGIDDFTWATIVALAFLEQKLGDKAGEWALVAKKAVKWLRSKGIDATSIEVSF